MAALKLFYYIEKNVVKAKNNPMWKDYVKKNKSKLDENPKIVDELMVLLKSTNEYRVI